MCGVCVYVRVAYVWSVCMYIYACGGDVWQIGVYVYVWCVCVCVCMLYEHVHVGVVIFSSHYVHKITKKRLMPHHFISGCMGATCVCGHFFPVVP